MRIRLLTAAGALAASLGLAACGGGSSSVAPTVANAVGQTASIRFVNASPSLGAVDLYFVSNGTAIGSNATVPSLGVGGITDFQTFPAVASSITLRSPGSTTQTVGPPCQIANLNNNGIYTVVYTSAGCLVYNDVGYTSNGQVRVHHASPNAANAGLTTVALGTVPAGSGPGTTATQLPNTTAVYPVGAGLNGTAQVGPVSAPTGGPITFAIGPATPTFTAVTTYNASALAAPTGGSANDTAGTIPSGTYNNASLFAVDCTGTTTTQGTPCRNGVGIIGTFDSK